VLGEPSNRLAAKQKLLRYLIAKREATQRPIRYASASGFAQTEGKTTAFFDCEARSYAEAQKLKPTVVKSPSPISAEGRPAKVRSSHPPASCKFHSKPKDNYDPCVEGLAQRVM
jgi:hypothetical protein